MYQNTQDTDSCCICIYMCVCAYIYNLYVFFIAYDSPSLASWLYFLGGRFAVESELTHRDLFMILGRDTHDCELLICFFFFFPTCPGIFQIQRFKSNGLDS